MDFTISLAGRNIRIESIYEQIYLMCRNYLTEKSDTTDSGKSGLTNPDPSNSNISLSSRGFSDTPVTQNSPDLHIRITPDDIAFEEKKAMQEAEKEKRRYRGHSPAYLETLAVYRKIASGMLSYDTFLMHGAVLASGNHAFMLTAKSGTGKTTYMRLLLSALPDSFVVNGDKPLIRIVKHAVKPDAEPDFQEETVYACGTPWSGKEKLNTNISIPLHAICILERGEDNQMEEISFSKALPLLIQQTYRPSAGTELMKTMELLGKLSGKVRFFRISLKYYDSLRDFDIREVTDMFRRCIGSWE